MEKGEQEQVGLMFTERNTEAKVAKHQVGRGHGMVGTGRLRGRPWRVVC